MASRAVAAESTDMRATLRVLAAVKRGDFSVRVPVTSGQAAKVATAINDIIESNQRLERELRRLSKRVGKEGQIRRASIGDAGGAWAATLDSVKDLTDNVNLMAGNLTGQVRNIAEVTTAVANGDISKKITVDVQGEILELKNTINTMVDQLNAFANEVTRVAREVGTEGKLGGQADVKGVAGTWKDLTDNVNTRSEERRGRKESRSRGS